MLYRKLGHTDLNVSLLGFGASPLGNVFGAVDPSEATRAVLFAIDNGINFFDVSPYYGSTLAEKRLGEALAGHRDKVVLATKCGRYGVNEFDFSARMVTRSLEDSLRRLKTDYVDLFQVHDVEFGDIQQIINETIPAMRQVQEQGKARYIGITGYPLKMLVRILETIPVDSVLSYCRYNLMCVDMDALLTPVVEKLGIGLINASPLHMGVLTRQGAPDWHPTSPDVREAAMKAATVANELGLDLSDLALRFCLDHPYVSSTVVGMSTQRQVEQNLKALQGSPHQTIPGALEEILSPVRNHVWISGRLENQQ